jgi:hypothetical protein
MVSPGGRHEAGIAGARRMVRCGAHALIAFGLGLASLPVVLVWLRYQAAVVAMTAASTVPAGPDVDTAAGQVRAGIGRNAGAPGSGQRKRVICIKPGHWVPAGRGRDVRTRRRGDPGADAAAPCLPSRRRLIFIQSTIWITSGEHLAVGATARTPGSGGSVTSLSTYVGNS